MRLRAYPCNCFVTRGYTLFAHVCFHPESINNKNSTHISIYIILHMYIQKHMNVYMHMYIYTYTFPLIFYSSSCTCVIGFTDVLCICVMCACLLILSTIVLRLQLFNPLFHLTVENTCENIDCRRHMYWRNVSWKRSCKRQSILWSKWRRAQSPRHDDERECAPRQDVQPRYEPTCGADGEQDATSHATDGDTRTQHTFSLTLVHDESTQLQHLQ